MTRQEAIEWLEDEKDEYLAKLGTNTEAYDRAIEALEENPFKVVYDFFSELDKSKKGRKPSCRKMTLRTILPMMC